MTKRQKYERIYYQKNKERIKERNEKRKKELNEYGKIYYEENKEKWEKGGKYSGRNKEYNRKYYQENKEKYKEYKEDNKEYYKEYYRRRYHEKLKKDIKYRIVSNLRRKIHHAIKDYKKSASTKELVGCSIEELKKHIENQFQSGMNWENYGKYGWHIDHVKPCASFNLINEEEQRKCFNYTNFQPLWARDNLSKGAKIF